MGTVTSVAFLIALFLVVGNWVLEACESAARRHRALGRSSVPSLEGPP